MMKKFSFEFVIFVKNLLIQGFLFVFLISAKVRLNPYSEQAATAKLLFSDKRLGCLILHLL